MDTFETIYEPIKQKNKQNNSQTQNEHRTKYNLILKNPQLNLGFADTYLSVNDGVLTQVYGVLNLKALYIHKDIKMSISNVYSISKYLKIFFIDARGNILAKYKRSKIV